MEIVYYTFQWWTATQYDQKYDFLLRYKFQESEGQKNYEDDTQK